jgi:transcription elongation factor Elf1
MRQVTKGFHCQSCGRKENVTVAETVLGLWCKNCGAYVTLGKAFGLSGGEALILALVLWGLFG